MCPHMRNAFVSGSDSQGPLPLETSSVGKSATITMSEDHSHELMAPHAEAIHKKQLQKEHEDASMEFLCPVRMALSSLPFQ